MTRSTGCLAASWVAPMLLGLAGCAGPAGPGPGSAARATPAAVDGASAPKAGGSTPAAAGPSAPEPGAALAKLSAPLPPGAPAAAPPLAVAPELAAEQRWLQALFEGTPVQVGAWSPPSQDTRVLPGAPLPSAVSTAVATSGSAKPPARPAAALLRVEVPLRWAFDEGRDEPAKPLAAVLDRVAQSLARQPKARAQVAAPTPERTAAVQRHLGARGVAAWRVERLPPRADAVELRLRIADAVVERLE